MNAGTTDLGDEPATMSGTVHVIGFGLVLAGALVAYPASGLALRGNTAARSVFVPQRLALLDTLSVIDNIALADQARRDDVPTLAAALGVDHLLGRFPGETSMGERQRIGVARALHARAAVTILDEPTAHQDSDHTSLVLDAAASPRPGCAVVIATHDPVVSTGVVQLAAAAS